MEPLSLGLEDKVVIVTGAVSVIESEVVIQ